MDQRMSGNQTSPQFGAAAADDGKMRATASICACFKTPEVQRMMASHFAVSSQEYRWSFNLNACLSELDSSHACTCNLDVQKVQQLPSTTYVLCSQSVNRHQVTKITHHSSTTRVFLTHVYEYHTAPPHRPRTYTCQSTRRQRGHTPRRNRTAREIFAKPIGFASRFD
ncbi:hypothetical protein SEVIR_9G421550v4 [Setaria viridis]